MKKLDYQTWFEKEQMVDDTDVQMFQRSVFITNPAIIYLLEVNNRNTRKRCKICPKLTIKTPEQRLASFWCFYC